MELLPSVIAARDEVKIRAYIETHRERLLLEHDPALLNGGLAHLLVNTRCHATLYWLLYERYGEFGRCFLDIDGLGRTAERLAREEAASDEVLLVIVAGSAHPPETRRGNGE